MLTVFASRDVPAKFNRPDFRQEVIMENTNTILCAVDLGNSTHVTCAKAAELARMSGSSVILCHVARSLAEWRLRSGHINARHGWYNTIDDSTALHELVQSEFYGVHTEVCVYLGFKAESIVRCAKEHGCSIILVGSKRTGLSTLWRQSVTSLVRKMADIPIRIVASQSEALAARMASPLPDLETNDEEMPTTMTRPEHLAEHVSAPLPNLCLPTA